MIGIATITFFILHAMPGDPVDFYISQVGYEIMDPEVIERLRIELNLDKPLWEQYLIWVGKVMRLDLGYSFVSHEAVIDMISRVIWNTIELVTVCIVLASVGGLFLGTVSAVNKYSKIDNVSRVVALFGISMPVFWLGIMAILLFSVWLGWFPSSGLSTLTTEEPSFVDAFGDRLMHIILPAAVLSTRPFCRISRMTRASMLDVLEQDYVTTARAKGLKERIVIYKHGLRNALLPVVTTIGLDFATMVSGAVVTETVFAWPGIGRLLVSGTYTRDYPLIMGTVIIIALIVVLANLVTDVTYSFLDPRVKH